MKEIDEKEILKRFRAISEFKASVETVADDLKRTKEAITNKLNESQKTNPNIWSIIMQKRLTKYAAAAAATIIVVGGIIIFNQSAQPAYAIDQTLKAIEKIETVYFTGNFVKQGAVKCWMKFDGKADKPTHLRLFLDGHPCSKIDSPEGSFAYNERTNRIFFGQRDERQKDWILDFAGFFKEALQAAQKSDAVQIYRQDDPERNQEVIVIEVNEKDRQLRFLIDPKTKLPISYNTIRMDDLMKYMRMPVAVKSMEEIVYNQPIPEGMFDKPADAEVVTDEIDVIFHPGMGMAAENLSHQEACKKLVQDVIAAMNDLDFETVQKLYFPFVIPPDEMVEKLKVNQNQLRVELLELGQPYQEGDYWYISSKSKEANGKIKEELIPIKFFEFEGKTYCLVAFKD